LAYLLISSAGFPQDRPPQQSPLGWFDNQQQSH
jgi:hypothetical protein